MQRETTAPRVPRDGAREFEACDNVPICVEIQKIADANPRLRIFSDQCTAHVKRWESSRRFDVAELIDEFGGAGIECHSRSAVLIIGGEPALLEPAVERDWRGRAFARV